MNERASDPAYEDGWYRDLPRVRCDKCGHHYVERGYRHPDELGYPPDYYSENGLTICADCFATGVRLALEEVRRQQDSSRVAMKRMHDWWHRGDFGMDATGNPCEWCVARRKAA